MHSRELAPSRGKKLTVLIDSSVWIEYFNGTKKGEKAVIYIEVGNELVISTINTAEVYRFMLAKKGSAAAEEAASYMESLAFQVPVDSEIAKESARIKHSKKISLGDSLIIATARKINAEILTGDSDFIGEKTIFL